MSENTVTVSKIPKTPIGAELTCKGWIQEAAKRMLLNNLDPDVAEDPENLIVYGGRGKAARNQRHRLKQLPGQTRNDSGKLKRPRDHFPDVSEMVATT